MSASRRVVQFLAGFADGDAISCESRVLHAAFEGMGHRSEMYAVDDRIAPATRDLCKPLSAFRREQDDILIHHYAVGSPATDAFLGATGRHILIYHNITPPQFFRGFDDELAARLTVAREQLDRVGRQCTAVWADSTFNAAELEKLGVPRVKVLPLVFSPADFETPPDPRILARFAVRMQNILFVGRIAPNKCIEELMTAFAWYSTRINRMSRLIIVGSKRSCPRYYAMLRMLAEGLGLENVFLEDFASPAGLAAYYKSADLFVSASRHEGYCLPLVEAMFHGVPVISRETGGTPEAMGGAGVMFDDADPGELAELMRRALSDGSLRREIFASQEKRVAELRNRDVTAELKALLG